MNKSKPIILTYNLKEKQSVFINREDAQMELLFEVMYKLSDKDLKMWRR